MNQKIVLTVGILLIIGCSGILGPSLGPGRTALQEGRPADAQRYFEQLIAAGNDSPRLYRFAYEAAFRNNSLSSARTHYESALATGFNADSLNSLARELWYQRAKEKIAREDWRSASQANDVLQALASASQEALFSGHMIKGYRLLTQGTHKAMWEALEQFELAARLDTTSGLPYFLSGQTRYRIDRTNYEAALTDYREALDREPDATFAAAVRKKISEIERTRQKMEKFWGK